LKLKVWLSFVVLWALMSAFGILVYEKTKTVVDCPDRSWVSVAGLDGDIYLRRYVSFAGAMRIRKRHPAEPIVAAPLAVVGSTVREWAGVESAKIALILLSAALGAFTAYLLWLVTADLGAVAVWLSFAYVWLLASAPEMFAISQTVLVATLLMVRRKVTDLRMWGGMVLLAGGITITNGIKPIAAFFCSSGRGLETLKFLRRNLKTVLAAAGLVGVAFAALEVAKWRFIDGKSFAYEVEVGCGYVSYWFSGGFSFAERLRRIWEIFLLEPVLTHGVIFGPKNAQGLDLIPLGYGLLIPHVVGAVLYSLCGWSAWRNRCDAVVRVALVMVLFDVLLHVVVGWGLAEAQIYCGHWFYVLPVLLAGLKGRWWKFALAAVIAVWNLQYLGVFV